MNKTLNKKQVLLVTLQDMNNIGNRLQNYALTKTIESFGYYVSNPYYIQNHDFKRGKINFKVKHFIKLVLAAGGSNYYKRSAHLDNIIPIRQEKFRQFTENYIGLGDLITFNNVSKINVDEYNYVITGSDQVWHTWNNNTDGELDYFYLKFVPEYKRIAYAPSFGFSKFDIDEEVVHKRGLLGFAESALSIREKSGAMLIKELTGQTATVVPDPTFLLNDEKWLEIARKPSYNINNHFMLVYFLGKRSSIVVDKYKKIAEDKGLKIIDILDDTCLEYYLTDPSEFIWLLNNAEFIATDSFHATVFSIIFHKDFFAARRNQKGLNDMFNRISDLLSSLGLDKFIFDEVDNEEKKYHLSTSDWKSVDQRIEEIRTVGLDYLKKNLVKRI